MILSIDPGSTESAYVVLDDNLRPIEFGKINNNVLLAGLRIPKIKIDKVAIEMIASYGMPVGAEVFETCVWIGKFTEVIENSTNITVKYIYRKDEKMNLCNSMKANDTTIKQALVDRFAYGVPNKGKGIKKAPGWFYGFSKDIWQAYAVGVTYYDLHLRGN